MARPKPIQQVFEIRYEHGYRYLDRCGEIMLILEDLLPSEVGGVWMPEEMAPSCANIKCPDLDLAVNFDAYRLVVDQNPADVSLDLTAVASNIYAVLSARLDLKTIVRMGFRRFFVQATDSIEEAQEQSVTASPLQDGWPMKESDGYHMRSVETVATYETEDGSAGYRFSVKPGGKISAPENIDQRLRMPSHLLKKGQKEALLEQLRRKAQKERDPVAGVFIDIDWYRVRPAKVDIASFLQEGCEKGDAILAAYAAEKRE
jgi:hypothetical protein